MTVQVTRRSQINLAPCKKAGQRHLDLRQTDEAGRRSRFEFYQQIDVAFRPGGPFGHGTEQGQPPNAVTTAE